MIKQCLTPDINGLKFSTDEIEIAKISNKMLMLTLYTKGICNLKCPSCFIESSDGKYSELDINEQKNIVYNAKLLGARTIRISGAGEPMLSKGILELIYFIRENDMDVVIYTNGTVFGDDELCTRIHGINSSELLQILYNKGISIVIKINSFNSDKQDLLVGVNGAHISIYNGLEKLIDAGFNKENPKRMALETIICAQNKDDIVELYRYAREKNIVPYFETVLNKGSANENKHLFISKQEMKEIFLKLREIDNNEFGIDWFDAPSFVGVCCTELYYGMLIDNLGYIKPCAGIEIKIGNCRENSIAELWDEPLLKKLRNIDKEIGGSCKNCKHRKSDCAYGCRAEAFINSGDIFGEYNECWHR